MKTIEHYLSATDHIASRRRFYQEKVVWLFLNGKEAPTHCGTQLISRPGFPNRIWLPTITHTGSNQTRKHPRLYLE